MFVRHCRRAFSNTAAEDLTNVVISRLDLTSGGCGVATLSSQDKPDLTIHVPNSVTGDTIQIKDYRIPKKSRRRRRKRGKRDKFIYRAVEHIVEPSTTHRVQPRCAHFDYCGGCQLQHVDYAHQLSTKEEWLRHEFLKAADEHGTTMKMCPPNMDIRPIIGCTEEHIFEYRNKMEFTFSTREFYQDTNEQGLQPVLPFVLGLHPSRQTNSTRGRWHDKIVRLNKCHLQTPTCNVIMLWVAKAVERYELPIYDQTIHEGFMKNLILRSSHNNATEEIFIEFRTGVQSENDPNVVRLNSLIEELNLHFNAPLEDSDASGATAAGNGNRATEKQSKIVGIVSTVDAQAKRHQQMDVSSEHITVHSGTSYYSEAINGSTFQVSRGAFFQPNPKQAQLLFSECASLLELDGTQTLWDLYCGAGVVGIALAGEQRVSTLIGIELNKEAVLDAERNAAANGFSTDIASFHSVDLNTKKTNNALELLDLPNPDIIVVDPPRAGK